MLRNFLALKIEPQEQPTFNPNKDDSKKEFKSTIQKPKRKLKSAVINSKPIV